MSRLVLATLIAMAAPAALAQEADTYRQAFDAIQQAVAASDGVALAEWVSYPIEVKSTAKPLAIADAAEFAAHYSEIVTPEIADAVTNQKFDELFINADGAMFGGGQVWMSEICLDNACGNTEVKIITIQSTAD